MKTILILRHGKSDWGTPGLDDFERPLAKRGLNDAPLMGELLAQFDAVPEVILASPARRAKETTELVAKACGYRRPIQWENSFYGGDSEAMLAALQRLPATVGRVMLVGHNPTLEETIADLLCVAEVGWSDSLPIRLPTAGLVCLDVDVVDWVDLEPGGATLRWFVIPKLVKALL